MEPTMNYPFNVRSFFTDREIKDIGSGIQLWRGYFQSVRPAIGQMLINVDISTATMYKSGPLLRLCLDFLRKEHPTHLVAPKTTEREFMRLHRFIAGMKVITTPPGPGGTPTPIGRVVKKLHTTAAKGLKFELREGGEMSVADYFHKTYNRPLQFPDIGCVEVGSVESELKKVQNTIDHMFRLVRELSSPWNFALFPQAKSCADRFPPRKPKRS